MTPSCRRMVHTLKDETRTRTSSLWRASLSVAPPVQPRGSIDEPLLVELVGRHAAWWDEAYNQRWELESSLDEVKTHQRGGGVLLRSKSPEMVKQEIWAPAAHPLRSGISCRKRRRSQDQLRPDIFIHSVRVIRRQVTNQAGSSLWKPQDGTGSSAR
jgi:hypothetical protein